MKYLFLQILVNDVLVVPGIWLNILTKHTQINYVRTNVFNMEIFARNSKLLAVNVGFSDSDVINGGMQIIITHHHQ